MNWNQGAKIEFVSFDPMNYVKIPPYQGVQLAIRGLYETRVGIQENGRKEPDFLHGVCIALEDDPVANIEWVFDKQKNDACQHFLQAPANQPTKTCMYIELNVSQVGVFWISGTNRELRCQHR